MKLVQIFILSFVLVSFTHAQSIRKLNQVADAHFEANQFLEAIEFYEKISGLDKTDFRAKYRLAFCLEKTLQYGQAKTIYRDLGNTSGHVFQAQSKYNFANILKLEGDFKEADTTFSQIISIPNVTEELVELSRRQREGCQLGLRQSDIDKGFSIKLMEDVNSNFHDFGAVLNPRNKNLVFVSTRNLKGSQYQGSQYIGLLPDLVSYQLNQNSKWRQNLNHQDFDKLNSKWSEGSGDFNSDGTAFYYTSCGSDEKAGQCQVLVSRLVDNNWSEGTALNEYINEPNSFSKHPSLSWSGDTLFFVSDRQGGFGGSDLWMSLKGMSDDSWTPAINMGSVINTSQDEISPYYSSEHGSLLFASKGHAGYGGYDLFAAKGESFFQPEIFNLGPPFNSSFDDTYFNISDSVGFLSSNRNGNGVLNIFKFEVSDENLFLTLLLSGESRVDSRIIAKHRNMGSVDLVAFRVEDYQGYELFDPEKREKSAPPLVIKAKVEDSLIAEGKPLNGDVFPEIKFENLHFSLGSSTLDTEVMLALDYLSEQLEPGSFEKISIRAFTDSLGNHDSNVLLSKKRGESVKTYLLGKGIDPSKIEVHAQGELHPHGKDDNWFSRAFNRRVEVTISSASGLEIMKANTYIVHRKTTVERISEILSLPATDIYRWNGFKTNSLEPGTTLRAFTEDHTPHIHFLIEERDLKHDFFTYEVKPGETLASIARKFKTFEELLHEVNHLSGEPESGDIIFIYQLNF